MQDFNNFSSLPAEQEASFVVYERRTAEALQKSLMFAIGAGVVVFIMACVVYFGVSPTNKDLGKDMDTNQLKKKSNVKADTGSGTTPSPAPAEAPPAGSGSAAAPQ